MTYVDVNRSVLSRDLKVPLVSAELVDGNSEFEMVGAANEYDLSANELMSEGCCSLFVADEPQSRHCWLVVLKKIV